MEHEDDSDTSHSWKLRNNPDELGKETRELDIRGKIDILHISTQLRLYRILRRVLGS